MRLGLRSRAISYASALGNRAALATVRASISLLLSLIELVGFLLPALPPTLPQRLTLLAAYAAAHFAGLTRTWIAFKRRLRGKG